jgi:hypothetical protein
MRYSSTPPHARRSGQAAGQLALVFGKAQKKFREAKLRRVIADLSDAEH